MLKAVRNGLVAILLFLMVVAGGLWFGVRQYATAAVRQAASMTLGTPTSIGTADYEPIEGVLTLTNVNIENPAGFKSNTFVTMKTVRVQVDPLSVLTPVVQVKHAEVDGFDIYLEHGPGGGNLAQITNNIARSARVLHEVDGKRLLIDQAVLKNVDVHYNLLPFPGGRDRYQIQVPEMVLNNLTANNAKGIFVPELEKRVLQQVMHNVFARSQPALPEGDSNQFQDNLQKLDSTVKNGAVNFADRADESADKFEKGMQRQFQLAGQHLEEAGQKMSQMEKNMQAGDQKNMQKLGTDFHEVGQKMQTMGQKFQEQSSADFQKMGQHFSNAGKNLQQLGRDAKEGLDKDTQGFHARMKQTGQQLQEAGHMMQEKTDQGLRNVGAEMKQADENFRNSMEHLFHPNE